MILFSLGLPVRFAEWCDAVTMRLGQKLLGPIDVVTADSLDELASAVIRTGSAHLVVASRCPVGRLRVALSQLGVRFVLALADPRQAVRYAMRLGNVDIARATRVIGTYCAAVADAISLPGALVLEAEQCARDPLVTAAAIADHLELPASQAEITEIVRTLADEGLSPEVPGEADWWASLDLRQRAVVGGALDAYAARFSGGDFGMITWERELFYIMEDPAPEIVSAASKPVDVTGRSRCLLFGPYISLPPGSWVATVVLGFSPGAAEGSYLVEVSAGTQLAEVRIQPGAERLVNVTLGFSIAETFDHPIEVRMINERAAFDGRLALGHVTITAQERVHSGIRRETLEYFGEHLRE